MLATAAHAGPPFLTDDPEPTETGHWEIYAPLFEAEGSGNDFQGSFGAEINYGPVKDVHLTFGLPLTYTYDAVRELLTLADDANQTCEAVDRIACVHFAEIVRKIADLSALRKELARLIGHTLTVV